MHGREQGRVITAVVVVVVVCCYVCYCCCCFCCCLLLCLLLLLLFVVMFVVVVVVVFVSKENAHDLSVHASVKLCDCDWIVSGSQSGHVHPKDQRFRSGFRFFRVCRVMQKCKILDIRVQKRLF